MENLMIYVNFSFSSVYIFMSNVYEMANKVQYKGYLLVTKYNTKVTYWLELDSP